MNVFDIITLAIFLISVVIGLWRGFLKTVIKLGAPVIAALGARFFGRPLGDLLLPELIKKRPSSMSSGELERVNEAISSLVGTLIVFIALFVILRLLAGLFGNIIVKLSLSLRTSNQNIYETYF